MNGPLVVARDLGKDYVLDGFAIHALRAATLTIRAGDFLSIMGPSGCGKSTLLRIVAGLLPPTSGRVYLGGRPVDDVPPRERGVPGPCAGRGTDRIPDRGPHS